MKRKGAAAGMNWPGVRIGSLGLGCLPLRLALSWWPGRFLFPGAVGLASGNMNSRLGNIPIVVCAGACSA